MTHNLFSAGNHTAAERFHARNKQQMESLETMLYEHLGGVLRKGYYGSAGISLTIHDGVIQHVRLQSDRMRRCEGESGE